MTRIATLALWTALATGSSLGAACQSDIVADEHTFACATTSECGGGKVCNSGICVNPLGLSDAPGSDTAAADAMEDGLDAADATTLADTGFDGADSPDAADAADLGAADAPDAAVLDADTAADTVDAAADLGDEAQVADSMALETADAVPDAAPDAPPDAVADTAPDLPPDAAGDGPADVPPDAKPDVAVDPCVGLACDDGNACTQDGCQAGACTHANVDGKPCDDGLTCTTVDVCAGGKCVGGGGALWTATYGGLDIETATALVPLAASGGDVTGFAATGGTSSKGAGTEDLWLTRYDATGKVVGEVTFGGAGLDRGNAMVSVGNGSVAIAGGTEKVPAPGRMWLLQVDVAGKATIDKTYGTYGAAHAVVALAGGGFLLAGQDDKPGVVPNTTQVDLAVVRTGPSGSQTWMQHYGDTLANEYAYGLAQMPNGDFFVAGLRTSVPNQLASHDGVAVRIDGSGALKGGLKTYGSAGVPESLRAVVALPDGGVAMAGQSNDSGGGQGWLVRADGAGTQLWAKSYGGAGFDGFWGVAAVPGGGFLCAGQANSGGAGTGDGWLVRTSATGTLLWQRKVGTPNDDRFLAMGLVDATGLALAGHTNTADKSVEGWLVRADVWGHVTCADAGACWKQADVVCSDGDDCTADVCEPGQPGNGCKSTPVVGCP